MEKKILIVELEGTLSNNFHRLHYLSERNFDAYNEEFINDTVNNDIVNYIEDFAENVYESEIVLISGMPNTYYNLVVSWLNLKINENIIDAILMRPKNSFVPSFENSLNLVAWYFGDLEFAIQNTRFVLSNNEANINKWENAGFTCWKG